MSDQNTDLMVLPEGIGEDSTESKSKELEDATKEGDSAANTDQQLMDDSDHTSHSKFVVQSNPINRENNI